MGLVYGIGINNQEIPINVGGKQTKEYKLWQGMLYRCTVKCWNRYPTYAETSCSENFKSYSFFYKWCQEQVGFDNTNSNGKRWCLDKDVLFKGNKHYSEDTCIFIPHRVNSLLIKSNATRGEYPIGVYWDSRANKFRVYCEIGGEPKKHVGYYDTPQDAFVAYKVFKEALIKQVAEQYKEIIDQRAYQALIVYKVEITD